MSTQKCLCPHKPTFIMLYAHGSLRPIISCSPVCCKHGLVLQIRLRDDDRCRRLLLEAKLAVPCHVLDGHEGAVCDDDHVEVSVGDEHAVRGFDDLGENMLDWIRRKVAFAFGPAVVVAVLFGAADEDGIDGAFGPVDGRGRVDGGFDICAVEVCGGGACGSIDELGGEGENVPKQRALLVDFVDVEAGVVGQCGLINQIEDVTVGFAGVVEEYGWLVSGGREGEVFFAEFSVSAGFV